MNKKRHIPVHTLGEYISGIRMDYFASGLMEEIQEEEAQALYQPHRHNHYMCFILQSGTADFLLDFKPLAIRPGTLLLSSPGQVHQLISADNCTGWTLSFDPKLIDDIVQMTFERALSETISLLLSPEDLNWFLNLLELLNASYTSEKANLFRRPVTHSLLSAFVYQVASLSISGEHSDTTAHSPRSIDITRQFMQLVRKHFMILKKPSEYAVQMNLSVSYLNDTVRAVTGSPVSNFIQQEIVREAQRLLCHSELSVKEIAIELGYEDYKYFNRLFSKVSGISPGAFRKNYRKA